MQYLVVTRSLLDALPSAWTEVWAQSQQGFAGLLEEARSVDARRLRLRVPGPLRIQDVLELERVIIDDQSVAPESMDALRRCLWARWWTCQAAVSDALSCTDLLALTGALRSWCEELAFVEDCVPVLHGNAGAADEVRRVAFLLAARGRDDHKDAWALRDTSTWVDRVVARLNGFVHPNRLGHLTVVHPEQGQAIMVALETVIMLSERALALDVLGEAEAPFIPSAGTVPQCLSDQLRRLPVIAGVPDKIVPSREAEPGRVSLAQLVEERVHELLGRAEHAVVDGKMDPLVAIFGVPSGPEPMHERAPELGFAQDPSTRMLLGSAVRAWDEASVSLVAWQAQPGGAGAGTLDHLAFLSSLANAAVSVLALKRDMYLQSLVRALVVGNPLAIGLAARGTLEHHAAVLFAGSLSDARRSGLVSAGRSGAQQEEALLRLELPLLRLLAGGSEPPSSGDPLRARALAVGAASPPDVRSMLERAFPPDSDDGLVLGVWKRLSELVHGRTGSLNPPEESFNSGVAQIGLTVFYEMTSLERTLDVSAQFLLLGESLQASRVAIERGCTLQEEVRRQRVPPYLLLNRDYEGEGTAEDPFRLLAGNYIDGYSPLLAHLGIEELNRRTVILERYGVADEVEHHDGTVYVVPVPHPWQERLQSGGQDHR